MRYDCARHERSQYASPVAANYGFLGFGIALGQVDAFRDPSKFACLGAALNRPSLIVRGATGNADLVMSANRWLFQDIPAKCRYIAIL